MSVLLRVLASSMMLALCACGGQEEAILQTQGQAVVSVAVNPPAVELFPGDPHPFTASISGTSNTTLTWAVDGVEGGNATTGTVSGSGTNITYLAPTAPGTHFLSAISKADPTKSATATAVVQPLPPGVSVSLSPTSAALTPGGTRAFTATVTGSATTAVTWAVQEGTVGGAITSGGVYTAPASTGAFHVIATSVADTSKRATATVTVSASPAVAVTVSPTASTLVTGATRTFTATVTGSANTAVTWAVDGIANGNATVGSLSGTGNTKTYTAPSTPGNHTLRATSVADATKSATATLSVTNSCATAPTSTFERNVKNFGAKGDGSTDDTDAIQAVIDAVAGTGGTVVIPDGTYMINATRNNGSRGLLLRSDMALRLGSGTVLKAIPNASPAYSILFITQASRVNILGGTLEGERSRHAGTTGESGMGIYVASSQNIVIEGVTAKECWGDGFYIGGSAGCQNVTFCNVVGDHNRRSGLSAVSVDGLVIKNSTFRNNRGTLPEAGINLEPNATETVANTQILGCTLASNGGSGIQVGVALSNSSGVIRNATMEGNTLTSNGLNGLSADSGGGIEVSNTSGHKVMNNIFLTNNHWGLRLRDDADSTTVTGNTLTGTTGTPGDGLFVDRTITGFVITGNTAQNNIGRGIYVASGATGTLSGNTQSGNGTPP